MHPRRLTALTTLGLATALVMAACGGTTSDGGDKATTTSTEQAAVTAAPPGQTADAAAVPSAGCATSVIAEVSDEQTYLDDSDRSFQLTTPPEHDGSTPVPLVLDFHGLAEGTAVHTRITEMGVFGAENGFAVAIPQGLGTPAHWKIGLDANPDLEFVDQMLDQIEAIACIDTSRVYATGLSNGAFLSSVLACTRTARFAAVAPVSGLLYPDGCDPARPIPVLSMHGTDDELLLFTGGIGDKLFEVMPGVSDGLEVPDELVNIDSEGPAATAQAWADQNGCEPEPSDEDLTGTVIERTWDCDPDGAVELLIIEGGGHTWPGSEFNQNLVEMMGVTDTSIDANEQIWAFFQRFTLPTS